MKFEIFRYICRYHRISFAEDSHCEFEDTCSKEDQIPEGESWGICDEEHCPYFEVE